MYGGRYQRLDSRYTYSVLRDLDPVWRYPLVLRELSPLVNRLLITK